MEQKNNGVSGDVGLSERPGVRSVSRREFMKMAGIAGVAVGAGAGLGGLLAACGEEATTTTTTAAGTSTSATAGSTMSVSAAAEMGREIKVGFVSPTTGALAAFGIPDKYSMERWKEFVGDGVVCGDGKKHPINLYLQDCQSNSNRAGEVTASLISQGMDLIMTAATGDVVPPVSDQCEANGVPCVSTDCPWETWFNGRGGDAKVGFKWTYHAFWGVREAAPMYFDMWSQVPTNKICGTMWPNAADGNAFRKSWPPLLEAQGYKMVDGGSFQEGLEDYTSIIQKFKTAGVEVVSGVMIAADFTNFWKQTKQQGFVPKIASIGKAAALPQTLESTGPEAMGICGSMPWSPAFPYKSSLTGETCQELADDFEARMNMQWTTPVGHYMVFELAVDALKRTKNVDEKESILEAVKTINITTVLGKVDFTEPVDPKGKRPVPNVYRTPLIGGQWVPGTKHQFDFAICSAIGWPDVPVQAQLKPIGSF